jgi:uncharacterized membrane protein YqjE
MNEAEPYEVREPDKSLGDLAGELASEFSELFKTHVELAKWEIRQDVRQAVRAGAMLVAGGVAAFVAILMLSMAAAWGLAEVIEPGWAFLIIGLLWALAGAVLVAVGRQQVSSMEPGPRATTEELREDKQWLKHETI